MSTRELDARVARALGLDVVKGYVFKREPIPCPDGRRGCLVAHFGLVPHPVQPYSTDVAAAWRVVEWMAASEPGYHLYLKSHVDEWTAGFAVAINHPEFNTRQYGRMAPTAPEAICLAFLAAMGVT